MQSGLWSEPSRDGLENRYRPRLRIEALLEKWVRIDKELIRKAVAGSDPARFDQVLPAPCVHRLTAGRQRTGGLPAVVGQAAEFVAHAIPPLAMPFEVDDIDVLDRSA
jgi:hypothetical protein